MSDEIKLSDDQLEAMDQITKWVEVDDTVKRSMELSLGGYAGTGKTTLIRQLIDRGTLDQARFVARDMVVLSLTGKAVLVLRKKGVYANTIHSTIYHVHVINNKPYFHLKDAVDADMFIVDEASMISDELYRDLTSFDIPILWVGDHGQLEPIGKNPGLMLNPDIRLEKIHRQAAGNPIIQFAEKLRKGGRPKLEHDVVPVVLKRNLTRETLLDVEQIICAMNKTRVKINIYVRKIMGLNPTDTVVGDRVICLKNDHSVGLLNGLQGVIKSIVHESKTDDVEVELEDGRTYKGKTIRAQFNNLKGLVDPPRTKKKKLIPEVSYWDYSYAVTCHKAQGSEWDRVLVIEEGCRLWSSARWAYTAATRASKELIYAVQN